MFDHVSGPSAQCPTLQLDAAALQAHFDAFLEAELPEPQQSFMEQHLLSCTACRSQVDALVGPTPTINSQELWGSSILVALLGPPSASVKTLARAKESLHHDGWTVAPPGSPSWAALPTSSLQPTGSPIDARKLAEAVRTLIRITLEHREIGIYLDVGRGFIGKSQVWGEVFDRTANARIATPIVIQRVRGSFTMRDCLEPLGFRFLLLEQGIEFQPYASGVETFQEPAGFSFWSGAAASLLNHLPRLVLGSTYRDGAAKTSSLTPASSAPCILKKEQRLIVELEIHPGYHHALCWLGSNGWMMEVCDLAGQSGSRSLYAVKRIPSGSSTLFLLSLTNTSPDLNNLLPQLFQVAANPPQLAEALRQSLGDVGFTLRLLRRVVQE